MKDEHFDQALEDFGVVQDLMEILEDPERLRLLAKLIRKIQTEGDDDPLKE